MFIDHKTEKYLVDLNQSVSDIIDLFESSAETIAIVVDKDSKVQGVFTNGDLLRLLIDKRETSLKQPVGEVFNGDFLFAKETDHEDHIYDLLKKVKYLPVLDETSKLLGVARRNSAIESLNVNGHLVAEDRPVFIIAEIGNNHNGSLQLAKQLVDEASSAGADCVKFQMRHLDTLYVNGEKEHDPSADLGTQYTLDLLNKFQLSNKDMLSVFDYARSKNLIALCTPWDLKSLECLHDYGMTAIKISSADLTNHDLIREAIKLEMHLIISTGMSTESEIKESIQLLRKHGARYCLLHCNSTYPAPFNDINLKFMARLKELGQSLTGYSGHERGIEVPVAAVAMGAKIIEKHFTLDKTMEGNDHKVSLLPEEFRSMVTSIRNVEDSLGQTTSRSISQGEMMNRVVLAKSVVASTKISKGQPITEAMLEIKSPGKGLPPYRKKELLGRRAARDLEVGDFFFETDISGSAVESTQFEFEQAYGIPVRYHDYQDLVGLGNNLDLVEFHFSYKDLDLHPRDFVSQTDQLDFVVHCPELFAEDHLLDLCSNDKTYLSRSKEEMNRVIELTVRLKELFPKTHRPLIVTNVGGFSTNAPLNSDEKLRRREILQKSLDFFRSDDYEILPQTMPPFPWHFGGQSFHNLFVEADDIEAFCKQTQTRVCLDISHSKLACNNVKKEFSEFLETVLPYTAHLHISDASGLDQEGLQILEGDVDFRNLFKMLSQFSGISFIPEVWQGHQNRGEGFWIALTRLKECI